MQPRRRDWLVTAAFGMAGIGAALALWPFLTAVMPDEEVRARAVVFDLKKLVGGAPSFVDVAGTPVMIYARTPEELIALRDTRATGRVPRDVDSQNSRQPEWARNWHRSLKPQFMICVASCTRGDCNVIRLSGDVDELACPCCGAHYDLAGRVIAGPAPANLAVPAYRFISETEIEFAPVTAAASRAGPA